VEAVVQRAIEHLQEDLVSKLAAGRELSDGAALFERVFETLYDRGHARLMAWLLLSGYDPFDSEIARCGWARIAEVTHALRTHGHGDREAPSYQDTRFTIVLAALVLFGQAIAGDATFGVAGFGRRPQIARAFRVWSAQLLARHLGSDLKPRVSQPVGRAGPAPRAPPSRRRS
jgi:hypothetical protein